MLRTSLFLVLLVGIIAGLAWIMTVFWLAPDSLPLFAHVIFVVFLGIALFGLFNLLRGYRSVLFLLFGGGRSWHAVPIWTGIVGMSLLFLFVVGQRRPASVPPSIDLPELGKTLFGGPGTIFAALLGLITILGFFATLVRLQEIEGRAVDYATLHERVAKLINDEARDAHRGNRFVWIMANAPTFGNLSDRMSFLRFYETLHDALGNRSLEVQTLCLDWTSVDAGGQRDWLYPSLSADQRSHVPERPSDSVERELDKIETPLAEFYREVAEHLNKKADAALALTEALGILGAVTHVSQTSAQRQKAPRRTVALGKPDQKPKRVPLHFVLTSRASIVFNTLDLPANNGGDRKGEEVHVAAFESTDGALRRRLRAAFEYHADESRATLIPSPW